MHRTTFDQAPTREATPHLAWTRHLRARKAAFPKRRWATVNPSVLREDGAANRGVNADRQLDQELQICKGC